MLSKFLTISVLILTPVILIAQTSKYDNVIKRLESIQSSVPNQTEIFSIGQNDQGQIIKGLKIGSGQNKALVVGTHHGNEYGSTEVAMGFAAYLAKAPISDLTVYVIPVLNISGYNKGSRYESNLATVVDPNRDYTGPCVKTKSFTLSSTKALANFIDQENIVISATLHTYSPVVVYPWGISTHNLSTPYDAQYIELVKAATIESGYQWGNNTELLYAADGTFEDYAYWKHGIWSLLFELGFSHSPDPVSVNTMIAVNNPGIKRFLEMAPRSRVAQHSFSGKCDNTRSQRVFLE